MPRAQKRSIEKSIEEDEFGPTLADCAARLAAMDRYERRALSRRKFAIREFDAAAASTVAATRRRKTKLPAPGRISLRGRKGCEQWSRLS